MTNPGPWAPTGQDSALAHLGTRARFSGLDTALQLIMIVAGLVLVLGVIVAFADESPEAFMIAGMSVTTMILCGLGRVLIHIARTLDQISADAREVRGISEWKLSQDRSGK